MNPMKHQRRRRRFSWKYDEDHHIGQYSVENASLSTHQSDEKNDHDYMYDCDEIDNCEMDQENGFDFCEVEVTDEHKGEEDSWDLIEEQNPYSQRSDTGGRRRKSVRKVLGKGWEIPPPVVMQRRNRFRQIVHDETRRHRRILPFARNTKKTNNRADDKTSGNSTTTTATRIEARSINVLQLLREREVSGRCSSNVGTLNTAGQGMGSLTGEKSRFRVGVPIITSESDCDCSTDDKRQRRRKKRHLNEAAAATKTSSGTGNDTTKELSPTSVLDQDREITKERNRRWTSRRHRPITDELRTYAEQVCVTKFESSYLTHLQHDIVEDPLEEAATNSAAAGQSQNNTTSTNYSNADNRSNSANSRSNMVHNIPQQSNNNSSKAVSTISIAFAPDGKTMASTHGDHTVKITCCMTGKLLQTLVGHPRTPWTVKYHPHAGADYNDLKKKRVVIANRTTTVSNFSYGTASREDPTHKQRYEKQQQQQQIVASGCLGHQVRIWDWISGTCLQMIRLEFAIISLSFHPSGSVLAIANGTRLHFWGLPTITQAEDESQGGETASTTATTGGGSSIGVSTENVNKSSRIITNPSRGMHIEMRHMLRCVHFLPDGKRVIVGGVNPQTQAEIRRQRRLAAEGNQEKIPVMSFYLRLWDFDLEAAKGPSGADSQSASDSGRTARRGAGGVPVARGGTLRDTVAAARRTGGSSHNSSSNATEQQSILESAQAAAVAVVALGATTRRRRAICNPRCFVPRALLYNDGGFDVSPDGKTLCACAEYWLPEGIDNATDLLHPSETEDDSDDFDDDGSSDDGSTCSSDSYENDVIMDDVSGEEKLKKSTSQKENSTSATVTDSFAGVISVKGEGSNPSNMNPLEDSKDETRNPSTAISTISPTRPQASSSSHPSATPPRIRGRQSQQIASPPLTVGTTTGAATYNLPMPPIQAGLTPQTPPPNVNPLNFPLSPPSPPGRRFTGGLRRGTQSSSQQHDQLLQQYNREQAVVNQHRQNQQQTTSMPPPEHQQGGSASTPPRNTGNTTTTIPAPPGINNRNNRQHRLHTQQPSGAGEQQAGNPFASTSRNSRGDVSSIAQRGRFIPHVVTISLDTEPYVETSTEEMVVRSVGPNLVSSDSHHQSGSSRIRTTTVAATSNGENATTTTVTKTTYNIPGRGAAFGATRPHMLERRPRLGQLLSACPLDGAKASAVTCVKFSPCTDFCLIGYGVREPHVEEVNGESNDTPVHPPYHPVTAMYKVNKGGNMRHISTMLSGDDDVNIARFHPDSGYGFVYGTKQGRIRILGPRPWNYYNC